MKQKDLVKHGLTEWDYVRNVVSTKLNLAKMEMDDRATRKNLKLFNGRMKEAIIYLYKEKILNFKPKVKYKYKYSYERPIIETEPLEKVADIILIARNKKSEEFVREVIK